MTIPSTPHCAASRRLVVDSGVRTDASLRLFFFILYLLVGLYLCFWLDDLLLAHHHTTGRYLPQHHVIAGRCLAFCIGMCHRLQVWAIENNEPQIVSMLRALGFEPGRAFGDHAQDARGSHKSAQITGAESATQFVPSPLPNLVGT